MVRRSFGCKYNSIALAVAEGILTLQNNIIAYGQFDVAFMNRDGAVITAPRSGTVY
ncbi:MAG: hypothetical protein LBG52_06930 [Candidatus Peribacteria bacterium]|nr:hypothetical protein [Candidatus Peribacteria bacterium]